MIRRKIALLAALALLLTAALTACGPASYADGTYTGQSSVYEGDEDGNGDGYGVVTITIQDNRVIACEFTTYEPDGTLKDEEYGKQSGEVANQDFYNKAQRAVRAAQNYAEQLAAKGELSLVDAISGATYNYDQFREAVEDALSQARQ